MITITERFYNMISNEFPQTLHNFCSNFVRKSRRKNELCGLLFPSFFWRGLITKKKFLVGLLLHNMISSKKIDVDYIMDIGHPDIWWIYKIQYRDGRRITAVNPRLLCQIENIQPISDLIYLQIKRIKVLKIGWKQYEMVWTKGVRRTTFWAPLPLLPENSEKSSRCSHFLKIGEVFRITRCIHQFQNKHGIITNDSRLSK